MICAALALGAAAIFDNAAQAQVDSSLEEIVVTAKSLEDQLPQQLPKYGTRVDVISAAEIRNGGYDTNQAQQYNGFYRDTVGSNHFVVYATHDQAPGFQPFSISIPMPIWILRSRS
jgi:outer membrane cobalamin receptor